MTKIDFICNVGGDTHLMQLMENPNCQPKCIIGSSEQIKNIIEDLKQVEVVFFDLSGYPFEISDCVINIVRASLYFVDQNDINCYQHSLPQRFNHLETRPNFK